MPLKKRPTRFAHSDGHTDVCYYTGEKGGLITCGADGDVRAWLNIMDDDPSASCVSDQATTVVCKNDKIYVGNDNNTIQILSYPDLEKEGIVTRFSATVSTLATAKKSDIIASGSCDMRIQVNNLKSLESFELTGHNAPILGLSLDPKEEFLASSSADGSIRIWNLKEKKVTHKWENIIPKCNAFQTAKIYGTPSFHCKNGEYLAYPHNKEVIVTERNTWNELFKLKSGDIKNELSICKFSECGTMVAASSIYGEVIVWDFQSKSVVGYLEHSDRAKITCLVWKPDESTEIAFADATGQLGCIGVDRSVENESMNNKTSDSTGSAENDIYANIDDDDDDDNDENEISVNKIKASVLDDDKESILESEAESKPVHKTVPEIILQEAFQPGSSPINLLSRYMTWNDVGIIMCYTSEDGEDSNIDVTFHDVTVHHTMHINNYLGHSMAALSIEALALACKKIDDQPSKLVVVALQGWGSGNKEWSIDLPEGEEVEAVAAGSSFVAVATSTRNLRIFMTGGTQREVIGLPGPVVCMNGYGNNIAIAYHSGIGGFKDQNISLLLIRICGPNLKSKTLKIPLSPSSNLMWLGFTDLDSPAIMDTEGIINIYDKKACLWRVACDTNRRNKGKFDNYFIIGIDESERTVRCILCKGSRYPPTTPRPVVTEIPLLIPLCEPDTDKSEKEAKIWQFGSNPVDEKETVLSLIALACRNNVEYRAVELCQQIASQKVIELAMKYASRLRNMALANKFESIAVTKDSDEVIREMGTQDDMFSEKNENVEEEEELTFNLSSRNSLSSDVEIKPLTPSQPFGRRSNPFLKKDTAKTSKGLAGLDVVPESSKPINPLPVTINKPKKAKAAPQRESFVSWFGKNKKMLEEKFPELDSSQLTKKAFEVYKLDTGKPSNGITANNANNEIKTNGQEIAPTSNDETNESSKKRKLNDQETDETNQPKRSFMSKLAAFSKND